MIPICHLQLQPILSGVQRVMLEVFRHIDRDRYQPHVVCQGPGPLSEELKRRDIPCHFVPEMVRPIRPWQDWRAYRSLCSLFRQHRFQLVHTHSSKPGVLGRAAARRVGVPHIIHHAHGFAFHPFSSPLAKAAYSRMERWAGSRCDHVIFVNHEDRKMAIDEGILPSGKCHTIYNGADLNCFSTESRRQGRDASRRELGLSDDEVAVLFLARLDIPKQPLILPDIVARLQSMRPGAAWRLVIAGAGPLEAELRDRLSRGGLAHRVMMIGWRSQPQKTLHGADVVLQPSLWEALPLTLVEAHASGLPVVASNAKGNREVVTPSTGFLCGVRDADDYARRLAQLIDDANLRVAMGRAARRRAEQHFDGAANMRRIGEFYDRLFAANEASPLRRAA